MERLSEYYKQCIQKEFENDERLKNYYGDLFYKTLGDILS